MSNLNTFQKDLAALIGEPTDLRPFVCNGSPLECQAFIVGFNPATTMDAGFWEFWQPGLGFNKDAWFAAYIKDRQTRPLKPGKTRRNPVSNTRRVLGWISESAAPVRCLETNIYSAPSEQATDLESEKRIVAPFNFLLKTIKPKVIVAHGTDAAAHIQSLALPAKVICVPHLSRGWSQAAARELGQKIRLAC